MGYETSGDENATGYSVLTLIAFDVDLIEAHLQREQN